MKKGLFNRTHIEGYVYEHDLSLRESGPNSKNPGTVFIMGNLNIATDDELTNIVPVHFTYVTQTTKSGATNATFTILSQIIDGTIGSVVASGKDGAGKVRIDSNIGLNEFYSDRNGAEELVSVKRNEGGFINMCTELNPDPKARNTFDVDMLITGVRTIEADPERDLPEKAIIKGAIFDFRAALLPVEFAATNPRAIAYFEGLGANEQRPVFTRLKGLQISETIKRKIEEESAFGEPSIRIVESNRKEFLVTWAQPEPYVWDDPTTITAAEVKEAQANREIYLAGVKQRQAEYRASRGQAAAPAPAKGAFNF